MTVTYPPVAKGSAIIFRSDLFVEGKPKESPVATVLTTMQYDDENGDPSARAEELVRALKDKARTWWCCSDVNRISQSLN